MSGNDPEAGLTRTWRPDRDLRAPNTILWRALVGGMAAGGLLGALLVLPDSLKAQFAPEPDTAYAMSWSALIFTVPIGALVGFMPALLGLIVWEWQIPKGALRARIAGSATAALAVVATAGIFALLTAAPGTEWTSWNLVVVAAAALISFAIAFVSVPTITTRRRRSHV